MLKRPLYLNRIRPFYDNEQIKVLMGVRRCGKTEILKMIMEELSQRTDSTHCIYVSFYLLENRQYRDSMALYSYLQSKISDGKRYYIFLDEIQFVASWAEVVNSIKTKYTNASIFLTGSNSELLNDDKERILGGRTVSFKIMPFCFAEYYEYMQQQNSPLSKEQLFETYMTWGGFPLIFSEHDNEQKEVMLESIFDSIVLRDIINRKEIKNSIYLEKIIDYVISSSSSYISGRNIQSKIVADKMNISLPVVIDYLKAIQESCIAASVPRFDIIGLHTVEFNDKIYA